MTRRLTGTTADLAAAVRAVNAGFDRLSAEVQAGIAIAYDGLDRELDAAYVAGDRARAKAAIRAWRQHWLAEFEKAAR
jgi:hypothetical protein